MSASLQKFVVLVNSTSKCRTFIVYYQTNIYILNVNWFVYANTRGNLKNIKKDKTDIYGITWHFAKKCQYYSFLKGFFFWYISCFVWNYRTSSNMLQFSWPFLRNFLHVLLALHLNNRLKLHRRFYNKSNTILVTSNTPTSPLFKGPCVCIIWISSVDLWFRYGDYFT